MSEVRRLRKKVKRYEEILKDLIDEESELTESSIFEKDRDGNIQKKVMTTLGESFWVVDQGRDLSELNKSIYQAIKKQDSYRNYKNVETNFKTAGGVYGWANYILGVGNLVVWFL